MVALQLTLVCLYLLSVRSHEESNQGNIYPQLSFQQVLYPDDVYASGYCLEDAEPANEPEDEIASGYRVSQTCEHGRIDSWNNGASISISNTRYAAYVDLGTISDIAARYNLTSLDTGSIFESIHWEANVATPGLVIAIEGSTTKFQPFLATDISNLTAVSSTVWLTPPQGHIYVVRLCTGSVCDFSQTELYYKFIALTGQSPFAIRWNVFYTNFEVEREEAATTTSSEKVSHQAKIALGLAAFLFVVFILGCIYFCWQRRKARKMQSDLARNVNATTSDYQ